MVHEELYAGPPIDDEDTLNRLPDELVAVLRRKNGFIQYGGGLHVRGACTSPDWHSLRAAWAGPSSFHVLYPVVAEGDVPFAEDCMGDQFLLREGRVVRLAAETGDLEKLDLSLDEFFDHAELDPVEFLSMHPLLQFRSDGCLFVPGRLLAAWPPFFVKSEAPVNLRSISSLERRAFLADIARQVHDLPDRAYIKFEVR